MDLLVYIWAKCGQGGEGVQNPEKFVDVLYVWSHAAAFRLCSLGGGKTKVGLGRCKLSSSRGRKGGSRLFGELNFLGPLLSHYESLRFRTPWGSQSAIIAYL